MRRSRPTYQLVSTDDAAPSQALLDEIVYLFPPYGRRDLREVSGYNRNMWHMRRPRYLAHGAKARTGVEPVYTALQAAA